MSSHITPDRVHETLHRHMLADGYDIVLDCGSKTLTTDTARGFDEGSFIGRNLWDRRYAVVDEERGIATSPDGTNLTVRLAPLNAYWPFYSVAAGNGLFVAVAYGAYYYTSSDGITATSSTTAFPAAAMPPISRLAADIASIVLLIAVTGTRPARSVSSTFSASFWNGEAVAGSAVA